MTRAALLLLAAAPAAAFAPSAGVVAPRPLLRAPPCADAAAAALVLRGGGMPSALAKLPKLPKLAVLGLVLLAVALPLLAQVAALWRVAPEPALDAEVWRRARLRAVEAEGSMSAAQAEAASKLLSNHAAVLRDMTNKAPRSQAELPRLPATAQDLVDRALAEVVIRLSGERSEPASSKEAEVWAQTAQLLAARIQTSTADLQHHPRFKDRAPDMSAAAGAAMREVLRGMASSGTA